MQIYGNNNPATKISFVCSEYLGENAPASDRWKYAYKPGEAGTSDKCCNYPATAVKIINWINDLLYYTDFCIFRKEIIEYVNISFKSIKYFVTW